MEGKGGDESRDDGEGGDEEKMKAVMEDLMEGGQSGS